MPPQTAVQALAGNWLCAEAGQPFLGACLSNARLQAAPGLIIPTAINKLYHTTDLGKDLKTIWIWILACLALGVSHFPNPPLQLLWGNCVLGLGRVLWLLWGLLQGSAPDAPGLMAEVGLGLQFAGQRFAGQWGS